jgi:hypothetical protein
MSGFRFSIAQLMAVVLYLGFAFAALRSANPFWASATFSLAIVLFSVASVAAFARTDRGRASWAGFAIAGWARLVIWLFSSLTVGSLNGPPQPLLSHLQPFINPSASGGWAYIAYTQTCNSLDAILLGLAGAAIGYFVAGKDDRINR